MNQEEQTQLTVGLQLLIVLSEEFNYIIKEREVLLRHRKIVTSFRDHVLSAFMDFILKLLEYFLPNNNNNNNGNHSNWNGNKAIHYSNPTFDHQPQRVYLKRKKRQEVKKVLMNQNYKLKNGTQMSHI
eukprot:Anaeramoba_flamelloidesa325630_221.p3 GENE.a325630_221~~a325630_221.p3  ORF type:complete len:128 (+),score=28.85 a325630_221:598-981(+)